jgi:hypothetical protein
MGVKSLRLVDKSRFRKKCGSLTLSPDVSLAPDIDTLPPNSDLEFDE